MWFPYNYRDVSGWQRDRLPLTATSNEAAKLLDSAVTQLVLHNDDPVDGDLEKTLAKMFQAEPDMVMGNAVQLSFRALGENSRKKPKILFDINNFVDSANKKSISPWEKMHLKALGYLARDNRVEYAKVMEDILFEYPKDVFALQMIYFNYLMTGKKEGMRNAPARVAVDFRPSDRFYGNVYGKLCFGYEECGQYSEAERVGRVALDHTPNDIWAVHSLGHVYEETLRARDGLKFLDDTKSQWQPRSALVTHVWWHKALFHIQLGEFEQALTSFDDTIMPRILRDREVFPLSDATTLLMRLELEGEPGGLDLADRWRELASIYEEVLDDTTTTSLFYDFHALLACLHGKDRSNANKIVDSVTTFAREEEKYLDGWNAHVNARIGVALSHGLVAYADGNYDEAAATLKPIRSEWSTLLGGSHAQKDILDQVLIRSAIKAGRQQLAGQLLQERLAFSAGHEPASEESCLNARIAATISALH